MSGLRRFRGLHLVVLALLLGGCARGTIVGSAVAPSGDAALVILGIVYTGEPVGLLRNQCPVAGGLFDGTLGSQNVEITAVDDQGSQSFFNRYYATRGYCPQVTPDLPMRYTFLHVAPGRYGLFRFINQNGFPTIRIPGPPMFEVKAGDVVYLGDLMIDSFSVVGISTIRDSSDNVRAALAARDGPVERLETRLLTLPQARPVYR